MKKLISILVILTMLVPLCLCAIPVSAASGDLTLPVSTWSKPWQTNPDDWHAISSYNELLSYFTKADTIKTQKNLYLTQDIDIPATRFYAKDGNTEITSENFILDGNGYAFKYTDNSAAVFFKMNNAVIRNLKLTGSLTADGNNGLPAFSPLGDGWQYNEKVTIDNVVSNVDITVKSQDSYIKNAAGVIAVVGEGSSLTNVKYTGTITCVKVNANDKITGLAGIVGWVRGATTFTNCSTVGAVLNVPSTYKGFAYQTGTDRLDGDIGMIVALAGAAVTMTNCSANGDINFNTTTQIRPKNTSSTENTPVWIGGLLGRASKGKVTMTGCTNTTTVNVNKTNANAVGIISAGGLIGNAADGFYLSGCTNNGNVIATESNAYVGGFVGQLNNNKANEMVNCTNGRNGTVVRSAEESNTGIAGFVGYVAGENNPNMTLKFEGCVNNADIMTVEIKKTNVNGGAMLGGFVGEARCAASIEFKNCVNNGDVLTSDKDTVKNYQGSGGFIGVQRVAGFSWTTSVKTTTTKFTNCLNTGNITNVHSAGGMVGHNIEMQDPADGTTYTYTISLENCANIGDITAPQAGGMYGAANDDSGYDCKAVMTFNKCLNGGAISGGAKADSATIGGIIGESKHGKVTLTNCVNGGDLGKGATTAGMIGNVGGDVVATVNDSYVLGSIDPDSKRVNPICNGEIKFNNSNYFDEKMIDDWFDEAKEVAAKKVDEKVSALNIMAGYGFDRLADLIAEVEALSGKQSSFDATLWSKLQTALTAAKKVVNASPLSISDKGVVTIVEQKTVNQAYYDLYDARMALGDKVDYSEIEDMIDEAEDLEAEDYTSASWASLQSALATAKTALASGNDEIIAAATALLKNAIDGLEEAAKTPTDGGNNDGGNNDGNNDGNEQPGPSEDEQTPNDPENTEATTDSTTKKPDATVADEGGCGSVVGAAAVLTVALVALGTGISFKKKD